MEKKSGSKKQVAVLLILVLFAALFTIGFIIKDRQVGKKIIARGDRAPEFRLKTLDGRSVRFFS